MKIKRALSVRQPYADQIMCGYKDVEFRTIPTNIRERVYIYASKNPADGFSLSSIKSTMGKIIGTVEIVNCEKVPGMGNITFGWQLRNPKRLKKPIKPKNKPQPVWFRPF